MGYIRLRNVTGIFVVTLLFAFILHTVANPFALSSVPRTYVREDTSFFSVGNDFLKLEFDKRQNFKLASIWDVKTSTEFLRRDSTWWSLYRFTFLLDGKRHYVTGRQASSSNLQWTGASEACVLDLTWKDFIVEKRRLAITVEVHLNISDTSPLTYWSIQLSNKENIVVDGLDFPFLADIRQLSNDGERDFLVHPTLGGILIRNPLRNLRNHGGDYPSGWCNMQFMAYYSSETQSGLYLAAYDNEGHHKRLAAFNWEKALILNIEHKPLLTVSNDVRLSYPVVVGVFSGDWYDAAQIYRMWATKQLWCAQGPLYKRADTPSILKKAGAMIEIETGSARRKAFKPTSLVSNIAEKFKDFLGIPVLVVWDGWEKDGWWTNHPEVFPPHDGWEAFDRTVDEVHKKGNYVFAMIIASMWSMNTSSWPVAQQYAVRNLDGSFATFDDQKSFDTVYAQMCPQTEFFQDKILNLTLTLVKHGVDFVSLDSFPIRFPSVCHDTNHGHQPGGGNWWFLSYQQMLRRIRTEGKKLNPNFAMAAEGMAEVYIPYFDCFTEPTIPGASPYFFEKWSVNDVSSVAFVPLWSTVYHDFIVTHSWHILTTLTHAMEYRDFYVWALGATFVGGSIPTVGIFDDISFLERDPQMADYFKKAGRARYGYARDFLVQGRMMRPPQLRVPTFQVGGAQSVCYSLDDYPPFETPSVLMSSWEAPDGSVGFVFTNIWDRPVSFNFTMPSREQPSEQGHLIYSVTDGEFSLVSPGARLPTHLDLRIDNGQVLVTVVTEPDSKRGKAALQIDRAIRALSDAKNEGRVVETEKSGKLLEHSLAAFFDGLYEDSLELAAEAEETARSTITRPTISKTTHSTDTITIPAVLEPTWYWAVFLVVAATLAIAIRLKRQKRLGLMWRAIIAM